MNIKAQKTTLLLEQKHLLQEVASLEESLSELSSQHEKKKEEAAFHAQEISKNLPLLVRLGRTNPLRILGDPLAGQNTLRGVILVRTLMASLRLKIQSIQAELSEISALSIDIKRKRQTYLHLLQTLALQQNELKGLEAQKIEDWKEGEIERLAEENDVNALLDEARTTLSKPKKMSKMATIAQGLPFHQLKMPVIGKPVEDRALQKKFSPDGEGIIFETKKNGDILAPAKGTVVFKGPFRDQGDILILDHGDKVHTVFMGMDKIDAEVGKDVYAGEKLGKMAGYGAHGPKLYFELRQDGKAIDPKPYLAD
jgi:septal ring factor EnvC (AmiA/AmiB activator)